MHVLDIESLVDCSIVLSMSRVIKRSADLSPRMQDEVNDLSRTCDIDNIEEHPAFTIILFLRKCVF